MWQFGRLSKIQSHLPLFAYPEVSHVSTGFSLFELLYMDGQCEDLWMFCPMCGRKFPPVVIKVVFPIGISGSHMHTVVRKVVFPIGIFTYAYTNAYCQWGKNYLKCQNWCIKCTCLHEQKPNMFESHTNWNSFYCPNLCRYTKNNYACSLANVDWSAFPECFLPITRKSTTGEMAPKEGSNLVVGTWYGSHCQFTSVSQ